MLKIIRYNSTVFSSTTLNWYAAIVVTEDFFQVPFTNDSITGTGPIIQESLTYNLTYGSYSDNSDNGGIAEEGKRPFGAIVDKLIGDHSSNPQYFRTVPVLEGLQTYSHPFTWRPNLFAITSDNNISNLLPNGPDCTTFPCQIEANSNNASFLNWQLYNPFSFVGGGLCEFTNPNLRAPCSHLSTWNEVDARAWTMGDPFGYHIDHFLLNPIAITESAISQEQCHLQCSPAILLGTYLSLYFGVQFYLSVPLTHCNKTNAKISSCHFVQSLQMRMYFVCYLRLENSETLHSR